MSRFQNFVSPLVFVALLCMPTSHALSAEPSAAVTPPRLGYIDGATYFWRSGSTDWSDAQLNTPVAAGDALYVGTNGDLELQLGNRAFIRADDETQFSLVSQTPDVIQFRVTSGRVSFDLRSIRPGYTFEVDTFNSVFTFDHVGYYRVDVNGDVTFDTRRGAIAQVTPAGGQTMSINPSEEIVVQGADSASAEAYVVPAPDVWDQWNFERSDSLTDAISERYLPYGIAGAADLDHYGSWRIVPSYGPVWVPDDLPFGWAPYSTGRWIWDPYYQWTWIDDEPWGWAPFHYGRWLTIDGRWAWAPGPVIANPAYAPALVAFLDGSSGAPADIGNDGIAWVALGWGEPVVPWWGGNAFVGKPWWGGWGGPREHHDDYRNRNEPHSIIGSSREDFAARHGADINDRERHPHSSRPPSHTIPIPNTRHAPIPASRDTTAPASTARASDNSLSRGSASPFRTGTLHTPEEVGAARTSPADPLQNEHALPRPGFGLETGQERLRSALPPRFDDRRRVPDADRVTRAKQSPQVRETQNPQPRAQHRDAPAIATSPSQSPQEAQKQHTGEPVAARTPSAASHHASERTNLPGVAANQIYRNSERERRQRRYQDTGDLSRDAGLKDDRKR